MRSSMIVHECEAGGTLLALRVELSRSGPYAVISIVLLDYLDADTSRRNHPRNIIVELLAQRVNLARFHQRCGLHDHFRRDVIEHPAFVVLTPAAPITAF